MRINLTKTKLAAALAPIALAGAVLIPGAGAAPAHSGPQPAAVDARAAQDQVLTRGFDIWNYTSHPIKLVSITNSTVLQGNPGLGTVLQPGERQHFEVIYSFGYANETTLEYESVGDESRMSTMIGVGAIDLPGSLCKGEAGNVTCTPSPGNFTDSTTITFVDAHN